MCIWKEPARCKLHCITRTCCMFHTNAKEYMPSKYGQNAFNILQYFKMNSNKPLHLICRRRLEHHCHDAFPRLHWNIDQAGLPCAQKILLCKIEARRQCKPKHTKHAIAWPQQVQASNGSAVVSRQHGQLSSWNSTIACGLAQLQMQCMNCFPNNYGLAQISRTLKVD